jgi:hypothetical protein
VPTTGVAVRAPIQLYTPPPAQMRDPGRGGMHPHTSRPNQPAHRPPVPAPPVGPPPMPFPAHPLPPFPAPPTHMSPSMLASGGPVRHPHPALFPPGMSAQPVNTVQLFQQ